MENKPEHTDDNPKQLPYQLVKQITTDFSEKRIIGTGGFGVVYKGVYENGVEIAVKVLHNVSGFDGKEFQKEFQNLRGLKHQNVVELVGFCNESEEVLAEFEGEQVTAIQMHTALCFEYVDNGSLHKHISDENTGLNWYTRYKIIKGISEGLKYLREGLEFPVMHFDLKPDNILLDKNMVPKIADFGLSRLFGEENTAKTMSSVGTCGYWPPEYINHQVISKEFDIFSLGVIITKIMVGHEGYKRIADMTTRKFVNHVHGIWRKRLNKILSPRSLEVYCYQVKRCIEIAVECLKPNRQERPTIQYIVSNLNETETIIGDKGLQIEQFDDDRESMLPSKSNVTSGDSSGRDGEGNGSNYRENYPMAMPLRQLEEITNSFSKDLLLGKGQLAKVYKGVYEDGQFIAVKVFRVLPGNDWAIRELKRNLSMFRHQNIVKIVGYCFTTQGNMELYKGKLFMCDIRFSAICSEYMSNGSLELHISDISSGLDWYTHYGIIKGACKGLRYLHEELETPVYHLNLKPSKILLDKNMIPKIKDLGFSRPLSGGPLEYTPAEFLYKQVISPKHDIFSLGVIIIEIITGHREYPFSGTMFPYSHDFIELVCKAWRKRLEASVRGTSLEGYCQQVKKCMKIALSCVVHDRHKRPSIGSIANALDETETTLMIHTTEVLDVQPPELCFRFEPKKSISCLLQLTNKGDDRVAFRLVAASPKRYLTKLPLCGIVPPRCTYTLTVTARKQQQQLPPSDSHDVFTLQSVAVGEHDLRDIDRGGSVAAEYANFFEKAEEMNEDEVQELNLTVTYDMPPAQGNVSAEPTRSSVEIIATQNAQEVSSIDVHPTEPWIVTTHQGGILRFWNYHTMATLNSFEVTDEPVHAAKFIAREKWIVMGDGNGCIHVYSYDENEEATSFDAHDSRITCLAVHPTHPLVLSSCHNDHLIKLWDWDKGWECTRTFNKHSDRVTQLTFNTDDTDSFASASWDGTVKIRRVYSDDHSIATLDAHVEGTLCFCDFTRRDRRHLIMGSKDGTAQIWDLGMEGCVQKLEGHAQGITMVNLHPDLPVLITCSLDGTVRLWNSTTFKLERIISFNLGAVYAFGYIKDLRRIMVGCNKGIAMMEIP